MMNRVNIKSFVVILLTMFLVGCATAPEKLGTTYVSPLQYKDYTCDQIGMEMQRVSRKVAELRYTLERDVGNDGSQLLSFLIFPMVIFDTNYGDADPAAQYSQLKGEFEALEQVAIQKNCGIKVQTD